MKVLEFNLVTETIPVSLKQKDGKTLTLELREMTAAQRDIYLSQIGKRLHFENGKPAGIIKYDGLQTDLLALCLFCTGKDGKDTPVTKEELNAWPSSVVSGLYAAAQELNGLQADAVDTAKKD